VRFQVFTAVKVYRVTFWVYTLFNTERSTNILKKSTPSIFYLKMEAAIPPEIFICDIKLKVLTNISEEPTASIFRIDEQKIN
jgi:hypothetical protein